MIEPTILAVEFNNFRIEGLVFINTVDYEIVLGIKSNGDVYVSLNTEQAKKIAKEILRRVEEIEKIRAKISKK